MVQSIEDYSLWNISNRISLRRSQASIPYINFPVFFAAEQCMKTPVKVSMKVQGDFSRMSIQNVNHLQMYFCGIRPSLIFFFFFFFDRVAWRHVCNTRTCAQKMSCFHVFPGKGRPFISCPGKKYHIFGKKIASFQIIQESSYAGAAPFRKAVFSEILKKYFFVFF